MPEPTGTEKYPFFLVPFGVAIEAVTELTIVEQIFQFLLAIERSHHVLNRDPVTGLVEIDWMYLRIAFHETVNDEDFRHYVIRTAGVSAKPLDVCQSGKEDQAVAHQLNVIFQSVPLIIGKAALSC